MGGGEFEGFTGLGGVVGQVRVLRVFSIGHSDGKRKKGTVDV